MNKTKKILVCSCAFLGAGILIYSSFQDAPKDNVNYDALPNDGVDSYIDTADTTVTPTAPKEEEKVSAWVMGEHDFTENDYTFFKTAKWSTKLPDDARFVLIPHETAVTAEQTAIIQQWIEDKKTVLFYGFNVNPEEVKEKIDLPGMDVVDVKSIMSLSYLLYGYGYSEEHHQNIPVFLSSNTDQHLEDRIATFLFEEIDY